MKEKYLQRKQELVDELSSLSGLIRGSLVHSQKQCGREECLCATEGVLHPFTCLSRSVGKKKHKVIYVKPREEPLYAKAVKDYARMKEIIEELSEINIRLIRRQHRRNGSG